MFRLLSLTILLTVLASSSWASQTSLIANTQLRPSQAVYGGNAKNMPIDAEFLFAIDYSSKRAPSNLKKAVDDVVYSLPTWLRVAVRKSSGDQECVVFVNNVEYFGIALEWYIDYWSSKSTNEKLAKTLAPEAADADAVEAEFQENVCKEIQESNRQ